MSMNSASSEKATISSNFRRVSSLLEVGTGFHPELTGRDNIFLNGAVLGMSRAETRAKFDEIVDFAELAEFIDMPVKRYSTGMFMRLAFAVAAHLDPEVLLVDEVLSVGDQAFQEKSFNRIDEITRSGRTVVFVSHDTGALARLCRRGLLITGGRLVYDGVIEETIERYVGTRRALVGGGNLETAEHDGTGDVRLRSLVVENAAGGAELYIDQPAVVRAELHARRPGLSGLRLELTVSSAVAGVLVAVATPLDRIEERTTITCWLEELPLRPGNYFVSASITRAGEIVDRVQGQVELALLAPETDLAAETPAPVVVRHRWIAEEERPAAAGTIARVVRDSGER